MPSKWYRDLSLFIPRFPEKEYYERAIYPLMYFAVIRDAVYRHMLWKGVPRPRKAKKGKSYLETVAEIVAKLPDDRRYWRIRVNLEDAFRRREIYGEELFNKYLSIVADRFFRHRVHRSLKEVMNQLGFVYSDIMRAVHKTMDVSPMTIFCHRVRIDYFISCLDRILTKIMYEIKNVWSIVSGRCSETEKGTTNIDYLSPGQIAESELGDPTIADPALILEAKETLMQRIQRKLKSRLIKKGSKKFVLKIKKVQAPVIAPVF